MTDLLETQEAAEERLYRAETVAKRLDVGRSKVYDLIHSGELRSVKIGGSRRIPETAVREFLAGLNG